MQCLACLSQVANVINYVEPDSKTKKPKKNMDIHLHGLWGHGRRVGVQPEVFTPSGKLDTESSRLCRRPVVFLWGQGSLSRGYAPSWVQGAAGFALRSFLCCRARAACAGAARGAPALRQATLVMHLLGSSLRGQGNQPRSLLG